MVDRSLRYRRGDGRRIRRTYQCRQRPHALSYIDRDRNTINEPQDCAVRFASAWSDHTLRLFGDRWFHSNRPEREYIDVSKLLGANNDLFTDRHNDVDEVVNGTVITTHEVAAYETNEDGKPSSNDTAQPFTETGDIRVICGGCSTSDWDRNRTQPQDLVTKL